MNISVFGVGYVGLTAGVCFSEMGNNVLCMDIDDKKIETLKKNKVPIYEPGLEELLEKNAREGRLSFTSSFSDALNFADVLLIALGTPASPDGNLDLSYIFKLVKDISESAQSSKTIVVKSTVPPGTCIKIKEFMENSENLNEFHIVSNPEFMKEGDAINDFLKPDRIIIGTDDTNSFEKICDLYKPFNRNTPRVIRMDQTSSELTKYASNAMLATRISFMNELSSLCEEIDADIELVREGMATDPRIGSKFLYPGCGYGGSCFPKDVNGLISLYEEYGLTSKIPSAVDQVNEDQKKKLVQKFKKYFSKEDLSSLTVGILGLSFKPDTDDLREAPSITIIEGLVNEVKDIKVYDPLSSKNEEYLKNFNIEICTDLYSCCENVDAILLCTEWKEFRAMNLEKLTEIVNRKVFIDGRNILDKRKMNSLNWDYLNIGTKF